MNFDIDAKFLKHFRNLRQVFLYITDECNLRCVQCIYKPSITYQLGCKEIGLETALALISDFREIGASKLSILGGEPTLYGASQNWKPLLRVIAKAKELGYEYVRLDTNGATEKFSLLLLKKDFKKLDEISFSIDGPTAKINDPIRGKGTFNECVSNAKKAVQLAYTVNITCCIHKNLVTRDASGDLLVERMIRFAASLGAKRINFHVLFDRGTPEDTWTTPEVHISPQEWMGIYSEINKNIEAGKYQIPVRIPESFIAREEFERNPDYYRFCPVKLGERVLVHPNGIIRICSSLLSTPYGVARYSSDKIVWDAGLTNELQDHQLNKPTPCTNQSKKYSDEKFVPLCFSFKSNQDEFIWRQKLGWEKIRAFEEGKNE